MMGVMILLLFPIAVGGMIAEYREECRKADAENRELRRQEWMARNALMDAAFREQLDREELFRTYVREVRL